MTALSALVDELMGKDRNAGPNDKRSEIRWDTDDVCRHYLCGFCPAELFTNTRSDLGACNKTHDDRAKEAYEKSSRYMKVGYEEDFLRYLQQCWQEVERRIRRNHQRLQLSEEKSKAASAGNTENDEKITELNNRITKMLEDIEELGSRGEVDQAQSMMKVCDQLKEDREQLQGQRGGIMDQFAVQEKQMEVCEVCGAFLIVGDAQSRVDDHLMGKQHMGYAKIKAAIAELKDKLTQGPPNNRSRSSERNGERPPARPSSRERERRRSPRRSRDRSTSYRRRRSTSRDRRDRRRSPRERSSRYESRDRRDAYRGSRRRRSRERDRSRSRDRKRSRRSRDRKSSSSRSEHRSKPEEKKEVSKEGQDGGNVEMNENQKSPELNGATKVEQTD